jgi:DNA-binding transcriptional LysR family regulator
MELRQLRYFIAVAEELHFGRAAARLHMSQPPLSAQIRQLEHEIGVRLLERSTRRVTLTPAGELFHRRALAILGNVEDAVEESREADAGRRGRLRVGFVSSTNFTVLPIAAREFCRSRPRVELQLEPLTSGEQIESLHAGDLDVGLIRLPALDAGLHFETLLSEKMVAAVPDDHALANRASLAAKDLAGEPLVLYPYRLMPGFVSQVREMFASTGTTLRIVQQAIHHETVLGLVAAGIGLSILPASAEDAPTRGVRFVRIRSSPRSDLAIASRQEPHSPPAEYFIECLHRAAEGYRRGAASVGMRAAQHR